LSARRVLALLDRTIQWYREQRTERDIAEQPSDWPIVSENAQIAQQILASTFAIARADARMLAPAGAPNASAQAGSASTGLFQLKAKLQADQRSIDAEIAAARAGLAQARGRRRTDLLAQISELHGERDLTDARLGIIDAMADFVGTTGTGAGSLSMQIQAMSLALPGTAARAAGGVAGAAHARRAAPGPTPADLPAPVEAPVSNGGLWRRVRDVWRLSSQRDTLDGRIKATLALQRDFARARAPLITRVRSLAARGDALAAAADHADAAALITMRPQLDALATEFRRMSSLLIPFGKSYVLVPQYLANLRSWRTSIDQRYRSAAIALGVRAGLLVLVLGSLFVAAEFWRRAIFRYAHEARRRHQLLLIRALTLWTLVAVVVGIAFATELGSIATFAGLITAGIAVAMQSVLVSIVGYFFLIGKYGIRVGDRVQIGDVTGEVIHLGLVRLQLMELGGQGKLGPTGRIVAFANSIVFQVANGLFKQIPGVEIAWHEVRLTLPTGADPVETKGRLLLAVNDALRDYRGEIERQTAEIHAATASNSAGSSDPRVQLQFGAAAVEAVVRYPVHLAHAAEIDERVTKGLIQALGGPAAH
jgi:small-conductance mechanosensitive channel